MARVYCLDASACAVLSEDYPGTTRWHFQRELVACHSRACLGCAGGREAQQVVLIEGSGGRAGVALHPTADAAALQQALDNVRPTGEANLAAALKLALLVSRRFSAGTTHVTAFVASPLAAAGLAGGTLGQAPSLAAASAADDLRRSYEEAGVSLDVAVLCSREEVGEAAAAALAVLTGATADDGSSSGVGSSGDVSEPAAGSGSGCEPAAAERASSSGVAGVGLRLVWLQPVATAAETWQQLEPALELLEGGGSTALGSPHGVSPRGGGCGAAGSGLPAAISRDPRPMDPLRHPRVPLLAARSGVQQPALCRGESLSRLGHLSSDGMMRPWLPTYASLGQQAAAASASGKLPAVMAGMAAGGAGAAGDYCFVEVQPVPRWRTLVKVAAGRMLAEPGASGGGGGSPSSTAGSSSSGSSGGTGDYAAASARLLRSLETFSLFDEDEFSGEAAGPSPSPVHFRPDSRRGMLRLLQATKEPHLLKLVWSAAEESMPGAAASNGSASASAGPAAAAADQPLDMFGSAPAGRDSSRPRAGHAELLSYMPASAVEVSAARGPIMQEGCELWEAAASFEWEMTLHTEEVDPGQGCAEAVHVAAADSCSADGSSGSPPSWLPAAVESRALANGAQVVLITPVAKPRAHDGGPPRTQQNHQSKEAQAFWLQQSLGAADLQPPTYATASGTKATAAAADEGTSDKSLAVGGASEAGNPASTAMDIESGTEQAEGNSAGAPAEGAGALLAAALLRMVRLPPRVDLRRLRRDMKSGAIQVTPITVGPLPSKFVRDIVSARSAMLSGLGVENLDSFEGEQSGGEDASSGSKPASVAGAAAGTGAAAGSAGAKPPSSAAVGGELSEEGLAARRAAAYALLGGKRLRKTAPRGVGQEAAGAAVEDSQTSAGEGASASVPDFPCSSPQPTPQPPQLADSCASSTAGTPFGTPLSILPSQLVHQRRRSAGDHPSFNGSARDAEACGADEDGAVAAAEAVPGLPHPADGCVKREGSAVLAGASGQTDGTADGLDPMFPLE